MERRVLLAVVLSMAVLYAYQAFMPTPPDPKKATQQQPAAPPASSTVASPAATAPAASPSPAPKALVADGAEREVVVETADVQAVLSNRGGRVVHWRLKHYLDDQRKPVDLVPSELPPNQPTPFELAFED